MARKQLPTHLFVSDTDGALHDTRTPDWSRLPPLRPSYRRTFSEVATLAELKATLRNGGFAWPGGYPLYFIMADGEAMAWDSVLSEFRQIARAFLEAEPGYSDKQWIVRGCEVNWEDGELYCSHSNKRIESAYAEPEEPEATFAETSPPTGKEG